MKALILNKKFTLFGVLIGALLGYAYWYYIGCLSGTCPLKSNWLIMTGYGSLAGSVVFGFADELIHKKKKNKMNTNKTLLIGIAIIFVACSGKENTGSQGQSVKFTDLRVNEFSEIIHQNEDIIILDVRTPAEYSAGHLKNSILIDINAPGFKDKAGQLDKNKKVLVYCATGVRSVQASNTLLSMGYNDVSNLLGGYHSWIKAGMETEK